MEKDMSTSFRTTADSSHIYRHRTAAEIATTSSSSVPDSFAEMAKNAVVIQHIEVVVPPVAAPIGLDAQDFKD